MSRPRTAPMRDALAPVFARRGDRGEINRLARVLLGPPPSLRRRGCAGTSRSTRT